MIAVVSAIFCYVAFLLFETFALALDRLSPIKIRGLLEEHPERARLLAGPGEVEIIRTTTKVLVQVLLLAGLLTTVSALGPTSPEAVGVGRRFLRRGWLLTEIGLLSATPIGTPRGSSEPPAARDRRLLALPADRVPDPEDLRGPRRGRSPPRRPRRKSRPTSTSAGRRASSRRKRRSC